MPTASLQALLAHSIDYAGMFPPCSLGLETALKKQAQYVRSADAWMLNAFVLPVGQFGAGKQLLSEFNPQHPFRVSALGPKTENEAAFCDALENTDTAIRLLSAHNVDLVSVAQLEMFLPHDVELGLLREARDAIGDLPAFWETPPERAEKTIAMLADGLKLPADIAAQSYEIAVDAKQGLARDAALDREGFDNVLRLRAEFQSREASLAPPEKYLDLAYYQRALSGL